MKYLVIVGTTLKNIVKGVPNRIDRELGWFALSAQQAGQAH